MTGARQIATLLPQLKHTNQSIGVVSMCMGAGMVRIFTHSNNCTIRQNRTLGTKLTILALHLMFQGMAAVIVAETPL